jgi:putative DNA primase/helicase
LLDRKPHTLLVDEIENLALQRNAVLLKVFNAGHRRGGAISRFLGGWPKKLSVFAPLAVAAIGTLPLPLQSRAVAIQMKRRGRDDAELQRLDESDSAWPGSRAEIEKWARTCVLDKDPKMPFINRWSDNWRVLLAIADNLGHGEEARAAAVTLNAGRLDEDPEVTLLRDIRDVFDERQIDRIFSEDLVAALNALEAGPWADWRGKNDDRPPRKLTQAELGHLLHNFPIKARSMRQRSDRRNRRGYYRADFEKHWAAYCDSGVTPSQRGATKSLGKLPSRKQEQK